MRLDKYLADALGQTRSQVKAAIKKNQVTVNEKIVNNVSYHINENDDEIFFAGKPVTYKKYHYYMFHKPAGCVTAVTDKRDETVMDYVTDIACRDLFPVGRLDKDTEGLLFLTNDGQFSHMLMSPKKEIEKNYYFEALGVLAEVDIKKLETGIKIGKEEPITLPARVDDVKNWLETDEEGNEIQKVSGFLTIIEGRFHQVKRMLSAVGCQVTYLKRISIGSVSLDEMLEKGNYRPLTNKELTLLGFVVCGVQK